MQHPRSLVLLGAASSLAAVAAGSLPRGVGPEFASHYQGKTEFSCISDASIKLSFDRVNDNTCDCPDGSDEPGTAACAYIDPLSPEQPLPGSGSALAKAQPALPGFWCENKGHIGSYVPFVYVNDGMCDYDLCCDGSEEFGHVGGVKCENRCVEIGKEYKRLADEKRQKMQRAVNQKNAMLSEAQQLRQKAEAKIAQLNTEIKSLEVKKADLQKKYAAAQLQDRGRVVKSEGAGGKLGVLIGVAKPRVNELRNTLNKVLEQRNDLRSRVEELETILRKFKDEYNPNFNDEGVKSAVKSWEDYAAREADIVHEQVIDADVEEILKEDSESSGINWAEFESGEEGSDTDILYNFEAYLPGFLRVFMHDKVTAVRLWLIQNGILADSGASGSESQVVKAAREAAEAAERDLEDKVRDRDNETEDLKKDYGPFDIFRGIKGKCVSIDAGEYEYELCYLDKTMQKSKKGHGHTNMGNFVRIDRQLADDEERLDGKSLGKGERMVLKYEDGQQCWNGPRRSTEVWLGCADKEELWRVSEAEKCVYKMEVGTPAACDDPALGEEKKDEL
ncbi:glucosidase II beta subunit-like protein [Metarhizium robertsii]|uniref:Glucosidase 2 subunit beta n=2 Tax=Metarhizium robertsii TaxID=568076 RepID=E9EQN8_METRA|nr:PRKCSH-domain-containing protein [Metarhizium robertsii ARSEF 23]EFZ02808.1 PRKCSH-domain-containing protein [Metarhizium robertsii ARSEF 23]EXV06047.1 glucosidase II beta subunit-like protein [Metarhizium robertsii]